MKILLTSLGVCFLASIVGYFCLFAGGHLTDSNPELSLETLPAYAAFYVGYALMWPTMVSGYFQVLFTDNNTISYGLGISSQIVGYLLMGLTYRYYKNRTNNT